MATWIYTSRVGQVTVFNGPNAFDDGRAKQDIDNNCTLEEAMAMGLEVTGSEEEGLFSISGNGSLRRLS